MTWASHRWEVCTIHSPIPGSCCRTPHLRSTPACPTRARHVASIAQHTSWQPQNGSDVAGRGVHLRLTLRPLLPRHQQSPLWLRHPRLTVPHSMATRSPIRSGTPALPSPDPSRHRLPSICAPSGSSLTTAGQPCGSRTPMRTLQVHMPLTDDRHVYLSREQRRKGRVNKQAC